MHDIHLAILWHQHQPYYPDDVTGENPMPWVRLHGTKDYWGMAQLLKEAPEFHATINLVPSLIVQLQKYEAGHEDEHLRVSRLPADGLSADDMVYLLDNFFMVHPDHNIRPFARYNELYEKRGLGVDSAATAARRFSKRDILDLQCWSNMAWIHPLAFEQDKKLAEFRAKGQSWSEKEKQWLLAKQMELLCEVIPLHKELADRGQVELSTTTIFTIRFCRSCGTSGLHGRRCPRWRCHGISKVILTTRSIRSAGRSSFTKRCSEPSHAGCGLRRVRLLSRSPARSPLLAWNGSLPTKKSCRTRPTAGSPGMARVFSATRRCFIDLGASRIKGVRSRSCFAIMR